MYYFQFKCIYSNLICQSVHDNGCGMNILEVNKYGLSSTNQKTIKKIPQHKNITLKDNTGKLIHDKHYCAIPVHGHSIHHIRQYPPTLYTCRTNPNPSA